MNYAVVALMTWITAWDSAVDRCLAHLMGYIKATADFGIAYQMDRRIERPVCPFTNTLSDSDLGGCEKTGRSTSGWATKLKERVERSPLSVVMEGDIGTNNKVVHIWPYKSLDERLEIRNKAKADGVWPPGNKPGESMELLTQESKIMMPAPFSPMQ